MKKFSVSLALLALALALGLAIVGCGGGSAEKPGVLTVTDIPAQYNGKYALFRYQKYNATGSGQVIIWGSNTTDWYNAILTQIKNGSVDLPLKTSQGQTYEGTETLNRRVVSGSPEADRLFLQIFENGNISNLSTEMSSERHLLAGDFPTISFTNGRATVSFTALRVW